MAHKTNVTQVISDLPSDSGGSPDSEGTSSRTTDPVCGMQIDRKSARHMLFRGDETYYFCSKECQAKFKPQPRESQPDQKAPAA